MKFRYKDKSLVSAEKLILCFEGVGGILDVINEKGVSISTHTRTPSYILDLIELGIIEKLEDSAILTNNSDQSNNPTIQENPDNPGGNVSQQDNINSPVPNSTSTDGHQ